MKQKGKVNLQECTEFLNHPIALTREQERDYIHRYQNGDINVGEKLLYAEYALIKHVIKAYQNMGVPMEDLIQEA